MMTRSLNLGQCRSLDNCPEDRLQAAPEPCAANDDGCANRRDPILLAGATSNETLPPLLRILPPWVQDAIVDFGGEDLEQVVLDLGRPLSLRSCVREQLVAREVARSDLHYIVHRVHGFREDDRTGIDRTVHRIAAIRDRHGIVVGLTIRVGRALEGSAEVLRDLLLSGRNLLFVGPPASGKTTILRDATRILADRWGSGVIVVDSSNEIGGDGRIPHPGIGHARRVQVPAPSAQARILLQTLTSHGPQVLIVDELGFQMDVEVVLSIARRGVQMLATVHGHVLEDVIANSDLAPLVGVVALSGSPGPRRTTSPVFGHAVEVRDHQTIIVHRDVARSVDELCAGESPTGVEVRVRAAPAPSPSNHLAPVIGVVSPQGQDRKSMFRCT